MGDEFTSTTEGKGGSREGAFPSGTVGRQGQTNTSMPGFMVPHVEWAFHTWDGVVGKHLYFLSSPPHHSSRNVPFLGMEVWGSVGYHCIVMMILLCLVFTGQLLSIDFSSCSNLNDLSMSICRQRWKMDIYSQGHRSPLTDPTLWFKRCWSGYGARALYRRQVRTGTPAYKGLASNPNNGLKCC